MEKDTLTALGVRLGEVRRSKNVTQEALADMLGVSPKHISHVENADVCLSLKNLIRFCTIFDCSLDYLVFGKQTNEALSKLPDEIVKILNTGSVEDVARLIRYLQVYIELQNE
jgi:transcriptional regulator with XRE-family HTH domain